MTDRAAYPWHRVRAAICWVACVLTLSGCSTAATHQRPQDKPSPSTSPAASVAFSPATYPPPVEPNSALLSYCPSDIGLVGNPAATAETFSSLLTEQLRAKSLPVDLELYDMAAWPEAATSWGGYVPISWRKRGYRVADLKVVAAWSGGIGQLGTLISSSCGTATLSASWAVFYCSPLTSFGSCDPATTASAVFIDRGGTWLEWYVASGYQG